MKLSWLFGSTMEQHHLLWAYISVWVIQGGYACWMAWQWMQSNRHSRVKVADDSDQNS